MILINDILRSDIEHKDEVIEQSQRAIEYLTSFKWCKKILNGWVAKDFGYILGIFLFEIEPQKNSNADNKIWIIIGDIPPAYLDFEGYPTANDALNFYCFLMEEWIEHVNKRISIKDCYPVNAPPTKKYAKMLQYKINIIKEDILPCS